MPLTILSDADVNRLLHDLDKDDILELQAELSDALHWYSTSNDANDCCSDFQPERTSVKRKNGSTTLFMPASSIGAQGIKVVNIDPVEDTGGRLPSVENLSLGSGSSSTENSSLSSNRGSVATIKSTESPATLASTNTSFSSMEEFEKAMNEAPRGATVNTIRGALTLLNDRGEMTGLINADELTAFRTALASTTLLKKRHSVHSVLIFGAGKQAYWHARLTLLLRGEDIHHLRVVTRSFDSAHQMFYRLFNPHAHDRDYHNPIRDHMSKKLRKEILTPSSGEYDRLLKEFVRDSNVIFCTVPSTTPLFPATFLTNPEGRKKGRYIACIGSYKPHMIELHPDVIRYAVAPHHEHKHIHKRQAEGGAIIVDTVTGCLREAGEVIQAKLQPDQVVELGELFMLKREAAREMVERGQDPGKGCVFAEGKHKGLHEWLTRGNVIYKSVGLGLMDVTVGNDLIRIAKERRVGTTIPDF